MEKHKVFISYHHRNDQFYKEELLRINERYDIFINESVDTVDIDDNLPNQKIRELIRDYYLKDTTVTILLVGTQTKKRKHIDWEIYSSMINGAINKKSGILVINLPTTQCTNFTVSHMDEKSKVYPEIGSWVNIDERKEYEERYPYLPARIIDNLLNKEAYISVVNWNKIIENPENLRFLINKTFDDRLKCKYDLSREMRMINS
ncbi:MAG: TIR domain-containing protein [Candidatus Woesearchaeota archaeon]